jgi:hypothetical protein
VPSAFREELPENFLAFLRRVRRVRMAILRNRPVVPSQPYCGRVGGLPVEVALCLASLPQARIGRPALPEVWAIESRSPP